jgi:hypothetical protein
LPPGVGAVEEEEEVIGRLDEVGLDLLEVSEARDHGVEAVEALEVVLAEVEVLAGEDQAGPGKQILFAE